jgi:hypothetical protein
MIDRALLRRKERMTDTKPTEDKVEGRRYQRREPDPEYIRGWPVIENGHKRELLIRKDAVAWAIAGKGELAGRTLIGLRTAGAKAIPVSADYTAVKAWWTGAKANESTPLNREGKRK